MQGQACRPCTFGGEQICSRNVGLNRNRKPTKAITKGKILESVAGK